MVASSLWGMDVCTGHIKYKCTFGSLASILVMNSSLSKQTEMVCVRTPVSHKDPQMSAGAEISSHIQQQDTATKALTFFLAVLILSLPLWKTWRAWRSTDKIPLWKIPLSGTVFYRECWKADRQTRKAFVIYYLKAGMGRKENGAR